MSDATLPRLAEGIVDWNQVFDSPGTGLVAKIEQARSAEDLQNAFRLILKTLFNREGDAERRAVFTNLVNEILTHASKTHTSPAAAISDVKTRVVQILHSIKDDRIKRAQKALAAKARKAELERQKQGTVGAPSAESQTLGYVDRQSDEVHIAMPKDKSPSVEPEPRAIAQAPEGSAPAADGETQEKAPPPEPEKPDPAFAAIQQEGDPSIGDFEEWLNGSPTQRAVDAYDDMGGDDKRTPEEFFIDTIASSIIDNLATLRGNITKGATGSDKLPFLFSPDFAERFEHVLKDHILPDFAESSYFTISQMSAKPRSKWADILSETMADTTQGLMLWERWKIAWNEATAQQEEPEPPKPDPSKQGFRGLMTKLLGDDDYLYPEEEMTQEEWEEAVETVRRQNEQARNTWSLLSDASEGFESPTDTDNPLLMSLFQSLDDINTHVEELKRYAGDPERAGKDFDSYLLVNGKDLDLPLLCACYRHPDIFMAGEKTILSSFVAGLDKHRGTSTLPLCCRFLGSAMGNRFAE